MGKKNKKAKVKFFDYDLMKHICNAPIADFKKFGKVTNTKDGIYIFKPDFNSSAKQQPLNSRVLAVAHLDSVLDLKHFYKLSIDGNTCIINVNLDDRLGAYVLIDLLPKLGLQYDLLLTEGEESGRSTAAWFDPPVDYKYNWMFSFDRHGVDVVSYQYDNANLRKRVAECDLKMAVGSFSDISSLDFLGCRGINVGTGYWEEHTDMCHAFMWQTRMNVHKFCKFYSLNRNTHLPFLVTEADAWRGKWTAWTELDDSLDTPTSKWSKQYLKNGEWKNIDNEGPTGEDDLAGYSDKFYNQNARNWCMDCGRLITEKNRSNLDAGLCKACESNLLECTICNELFPYFQLSNDGICDTCSERIMYGRDTDIDRPFN